MKHRDKYTGFLLFTEDELEELSVAIESRALDVMKASVKEASRGKEALEIAADYKAIMDKIETALKEIDEEKERDNEQG